MTGGIDPADANLKPSQRVVFHRTDLDRILVVYGHLVANGHARDYGISMLADRAVFSIFKHAAEYPTWRIEKIPALARKQGLWVVSGSGRAILKRGAELEIVLKAFDAQQRKRAKRRS